QWLSERLGQPFIIENRPGGGTNIPTEAVVRAPADGYTPLMLSATQAINATLYHKLNFKFISHILPVAGTIPGPGHYGGKSFGTSQHSSRVHRLRQGECWQAQHGVGWHRECRSYFR